MISPTSLAVGICIEDTLYTIVDPIKIEYRQSDRNKSLESAFSWVVEYFNQAICQYVGSDSYKQGNFSFSKSNASNDIHIFVSKVHSDVPTTVHELITTRLDIKNIIYKSLNYLSNNSYVPADLVVIELLEDIIQKGELS